MPTRPASSASTVSAIGMSTPFARASSTSTGAVNAPSASGPVAHRGLLAAADGEPEREIARLRRGSREDEIAEAREAHQRIGLGAIGAAEAGELGEAAGDQCGLGAGAEVAPGDDAAGDGEHVLGGAADLDAAHVGRVIDAESRRAQRLGERGCELFVGGRERHGRRQALATSLAKLGPERIAVSACGMSSAMISVTNLPLPRSMPLAQATSGVPCLAWGDQCGNQRAKVLGRHDEKERVLGGGVG